MVYRGNGLRELGWAVTLTRTESFAIKLNPKARLNSESSENRWREVGVR